MKPKLLIVDDLESGLYLAQNKLVPDLFDGLVGGSFANLVKLGLMRNANSCENLLQWFLAHPDRDEVRPVDLAIVLDLGFRTGKPPPDKWAIVDKQIIESPILIEDIEDDVLDGIAVLLTMLKSPWIKRVAVVIGSGRVSKGVVTFVDRFNEYCSANELNIVVESQMGRIAANENHGKKLLIFLSDLWNEHFSPAIPFPPPSPPPPPPVLPDLHEDQSIAGILADYGWPFRDHRSADRAWKHDGWCKEDDGCLCGAKVLGMKVGMPDPSSNAALFMRATNSVGFDLETRGYDLTKSCLESLLSRINIEAKLSNYDQNYVRLPCKPGIAFVVALKVLLLELAKETPSQSVEFRLDGFSHGVRIVLANKHTRRNDGSLSKGGLDCVKIFLRKMQSQHKWTFASDGLSGAICNVAFCRVPSLRNPLNESWVTMLSGGLDHWVAWPSFVDNAIEFRW